MKCATDLSQWNFATHEATALSLSRCFLPLSPCTHYDDVLCTFSHQRHQHVSLCSTNSSIFHWKASISVCLLAPTVTDKLDKAHLSSRSLFKERESVDQYQAPTGVHSTQWVVLSANHYATVISPTCEKSRPCSPERSSSARLMMRWIFDQCQVSIWGLPFFSRRKAVLSQFRLVWWAPLPGYRVRLSPGKGRQAFRDGQRREQPFWLWRAGSRHCDPPDRKMKLSFKVLMCRAKISAFTCGGRAFLLTWKGGRKTSLFFTSLR